MPASFMIGSIGPRGAIHDLLELYVLIFVVRALLSWFPLHAGSPLVGLVRVLERLTEPVLAPLRRIIPPVRAGGMAIDLSFIIAIFGLQIVANYV